MLNNYAVELNKSLTNQLLDTTPEDIKAEWAQCKRYLRAHCYLGKSFVLWETVDAMPRKRGEIKLLHFDYIDGNFVATARLSIDNKHTLHEISHDIKQLVPGKLLVCVPPVMVIVKKADKPTPQFQLLFKSEASKDGVEGELCITGAHTFEKMFAETSL